MDNLDLIKVALGIGSDWEVTQVEFMREKNELHLHLRYLRSALLPTCKECQAAGVHAVEL